MKFQFLTAAQIDKKKWDLIVSTDPLADVFAFSWYLDTVSDNWGALISDNYETLFPFAFRKKIGIKYIYQPFFTRNFGFYGKNINHVELFAALDNLSEKFRFWDFNLACNKQPVFEKANTTERVFQALDLNQTYESISNQFSAKLRRSLRIANAENLIIVQVSDTKHFATEFKRNTSVRIPEFRRMDYNRISLLLSNCRENSETWFYSVKKDSQEIASAFFMRAGQRIIYIEGFSTPTGRTLKAMHFLFDHLIKEQSGRNLILDFGGSNVPSIAHFFRSFGGVDKPYYNIRLNNLPSIIKWLKK